jgi:hypothetical protein
MPCLCLNFEVIYYFMRFINYDALTLEYIVFSDWYTYQFLSPFHHLFRIVASCPTQSSHYLVYLYCECSLTNRYIYYTLSPFRDQMASHAYSFFFFFDFLYYGSGYKFLFQAYYNDFTTFLVIVIR